MISKSISSVPIVEKPAAASRLDNMIHQTNTNGSSYYNTIDTRNLSVEPIAHSGSVSSSSSSRSASTTRSNRADTYELAPTKNARLSGRNSNLHRSLESIPHKPSQVEQGLSVANKAASLDFGTKPVGYDDPSSIYVTPSEAPYPASEFQTVVKGWLRKQNRG
jgi:hypothetical protein